MAITSRSVCTHNFAVFRSHSPQLSIFSAPQTQAKRNWSVDAHQKKQEKPNKTRVDCKCLPMHLMYLKILLHKGALCYSVTKGHSIKEVQYLCTSVGKQKTQQLSQSCKLKTKMKLFYLFLYCGEIQRETVARKRCNLTLNLCTKACVQKKEEEKST